MTSQMSEEGKHFCERTKLIVRPTSHLSTFINLSFIFSCIYNVGLVANVDQSYLIQQHPNAPGMDVKVNVMPDGTVALAEA